MLATCYAGYPNFFTLMGPNSATGHSSVIFTSEAQISMILKLIKPILAKPTMTKPVYIAVKKQAEIDYMAKLRSQMKAKVWEKDGGVSWYVDRTTGLCTTLCTSDFFSCFVQLGTDLLIGLILIDPWSQVRCFQSSSTYDTKKLTKYIVSNRSISGGTQLSP